MQVASQCKFLHLSISVEESWAFRICSPSASPCVPWLGTLTCFRLGISKSSSWLQAYASCRSCDLFQYVFTGLRLIVHSYLLIILMVLPYKYMLMGWVFEQMAKCNNFSSGTYDLWPVNYRSLWSSHNASCIIRIGFEFLLRHFYTIEVPFQSMIYQFQLLKAHQINESQR